MSAELRELRRIAERERACAIGHVKMIPGRVGDAASAYTKAHPMLAMGAAALLSSMLAARRARRFGVKGRASRWFTAAAAFGTRLLPDLLQIAGLTAQRARAKTTASAPGPAPHAPSN